MPDSTSPRAEGAPEGRPAFFLDRDGTIILDRDYPGTPDEVELLPGAAAAIRRLNQAGYPVVVVTNQSGIARGYITEADYHAVHARMLELLEREGARVDATYFCPHGPDLDPPCQCRKPRSGLFRQAAAELGLDLRGSFFIGDRIRDIEPGVRLGGTGMLLPRPDASGDTVVDGVKIRRFSSLAEAVDHALADSP